METFDTENKSINIVIFSKPEYQDAPIAEIKIMKPIDNNVKCVKLANPLKYLLKFEIIFISFLVSFYRLVISHLSFFTIGYNGLLYEMLPTNERVLARIMTSLKRVQKSRICRC